MIKYQGISTLEVLQEANNYNKWIANSILKHVSSPVLEIGAGTGNLSKHFLKQKKIFLTDIDAGLVKLLKKTFSKEKNVFVKRLNITQKIPKNIQSAFASVYAINVLEHITDDEKALRNIHKILKENGKLLLLVPAKKIAFTKLDQELGHIRRYEKKELKEKLLRNKFTIEKMYFFNIVGLLSWVIRDKVMRKNIHLQSHHIKIFDSIVPMLRVIESIIPVPVGISLIVVARKA